MSDIAVKTLFVVLKKVRMKQREFRCYYFLICLAIITVSLIRFFVFSSYKIPSPSMEPAILAGDFVLVNKLIPGTRFINNFISCYNGEEAQISRLLCLKSIERNDILVFNYPYDKENRMTFNGRLNVVKRCVAIPGDTFYIEKGVYKVKNIKDTLGCYKSQQDYYKCITQCIGKVADRAFPFDKEHNWTVLDFGPLYVPRRGDTLTINSTNIILYRNLLYYETNRNPLILNDMVLLDGKQLTKYVFRNNYYIVAGDNVRNSFDSRYWGLLPEPFIVGKAVRILKSVDMETGKTRWNRVFKKIE